MRKDKPSITARKVALSIITLGEKPGMEKIIPPGVVEATARLLVASGALGARQVRWSRSRRMVSVYEAFDWMLPGQFEAFAYRKAYCERQVRDALDACFTQVLVLGAGYDTLAWRLSPDYPDVNFFEIDHPATARLKAKGIDVMGHRDNLALIAEDLGQRKLLDVLTSNEQWDQDAKTIIVAEGLVMYLQSEAVRDLFYQCAVAVTVGSRILFSYFLAGEDGRPDVGRWTGMLLWLQKATGEPWLWSIQPGELGPFLEESGWIISPSLTGPNVRYGVEFYVVATKNQ